MVFKRAVGATGRGKATPIISSSYPDNPTDYDTPGNGGINEWQSSDEGAWSATADVEFVDGQATIPLDIFNDGVADGNDTIIWTIDDSAPFGFSQEIYIFNEAVDVNSDQFVGTTVDIPLSLDSSIKTATIIIEDTNSVLTPIIGNDAKNSLNGSNDNDIIYAKAGNDKVNGRRGDDSLYGEADNDTLLGGSDNDYLNGGSGKDKLYGEAGNDTLDGLNGNDSLDGSSGNDRLLGWYGKDYLNGGNGDDYLDGEADNDTLVGGSGSDNLIGGSGSDNLIGGKDDDFYNVDSTTDTITESSNEGTDTVESSVSFMLDNNLENLTLKGSSDISGTGNALDNAIYGNDANNTLFGGDGNDMLSGDGQFSAQSGNDMLSGGAGNDILVGSDGSDTLTGDVGADQFTFDDPYDGEADTITDFNSSEGDKIVVSMSNFTSQDESLAIGELPADRFTIGSAAADTSDRFIYNLSTGELFYDFDGTSLTAVLPSGQRQIASLSPGLELTSSDISVIA